MIFDKLFSLFTADLAIDLGTANTLIYAKGKGIVVREPSVVAVQVDSRGNKVVLAVGADAKDMLGRTPSGIVAVRPVKDGVISDFEVTEAMLRYFISKANRGKTYFHPRIIVAVPFAITEAEKKIMHDSTKSAGAREVYLIKEPMAAALGAGLPISEASGNMVVDIGGGTTEVAVISMSGIVYSDSVRVGGDHMDRAILNHIKTKYNLLIGERSAEDIKCNIGMAYPGDEVLTMTVKGRDAVAGLPKTVEVNSDEIRDALHDPIEQIIRGVKGVLENTPPELSGDIIDKGIVMTGGGSLLKNLDILLREETQLPVFLADDPMTAVVMGAGRALDQIEVLKETAALT